MKNRWIKECGVQDNGSGFETFANVKDVGQYMTPITWLRKEFKDKAKAEEWLKQKLKDSFNINVEKNAFLFLKPDGSPE